jgi:DNA-binding NarL/FixJ family response regulator
LLGILAEKQSAVGIFREIHMKFSPREATIVRLIQLGHTNKQIGKTLALSPHTVRDCISTMLARHQMNSRTALVAAVSRSAQHIPWGGGA